MSIRIRRAAPAAPALQLVERTAHFTVRGGRVYQDVIVRAGDGALYRAKVAA